jgi:anti-sigma B factor antagonist
MSWKLTERARVTCFATAMAKTKPSILPLEGEIDLHVSPQIGASLATLIAKKPSQLVVDLSKVSYIDSSGIAILIEAMQNVSRYGGKFALSGLQENVRPIFEIARLDQIFRIFPDTASALGT